MDCCTFAWHTKFREVQSYCAQTFTLTRFVLQITATSKRDYSEDARSLGVTFFQDVDDLCEDHPDVVILATSILSTKAVVKTLPVQRLRRSTLIVDVLSVKSFPKQLMLSELPEGVRFS